MRLLNRHYKLRSGQDYNVQEFTVSWLIILHFTRNILFFISFSQIGCSVSDISETFETRKFGDNCIYTSAGNILRILGILQRLNLRRLYGNEYDLHRTAKH